MSVISLYLRTNCKPWFGERTAYIRNTFCIPSRVLRTGSLSTASSALRLIAALVASALLRSGSSAMNPATCDRVATPSTSHMQRPFEPHQNCSEPLDCVSQLLLSSLLPDSPVCVKDAVLNALYRTRQTKNTCVHLTFRFCLRSTSNCAKARK